MNELTFLFLHKVEQFSFLANLWANKTLLQNVKHTRKFDVMFFLIKDRNWISCGHFNWWPDNSPELSERDKFECISYCFQQFTQTLTFPCVGNSGWSCWLLPRKTTLWTMQGEVWTFVDKWRWALQSWNLPGVHQTPKKVCSWSWQIKTYYKWFF